MGLQTCVEIFTFDGPPGPTPSPSMGNPAHPDVSSRHVTCPSGAANSSAGSKRNGTQLACDAARASANVPAAVKESDAARQRGNSAPRRLFQQQVAGAGAGTTAGKTGSAGVAATNLLSALRWPASRAVPLPPSEHERRNLSTTDSSSSSGGGTRNNKSLGWESGRSTVQGHEHEVGGQGSGNPSVSLVSVLTVGLDEKAGEGKGQPHVIVVLLVNGVRYVTYACLMPGLQGTAGAAAGATVSV